MKLLTYDIHEFLTRMRRNTSSLDKGGDFLDSKPVAKEYPRMTRIKLPSPQLLNVGLQEAIVNRKSSHQLVVSPLNNVELSTLLAAVSAHEDRGRTYPSGGGKYPIETYLLIQSVSGYARGVYHYHAPSHSLEHLWDLPNELEIFPGINVWAEKARMILIFTGSWWKNALKYEDFSYLLGVLETGHMAQNILLTASALGIPTCPLAGFNDDRVSELLDLDPQVEQPVYAIALG